MNSSLDQKSLTEYLIRQLEYFYPDQIDIKEGIIRIMPSVLERMEYCFRQIHKKYYFEEGQVVFNHLNSDHYSMFLYLMANEAYKQQFINIAEKSFLLNKALHGIDAFYSINLPEVFLFVHPIGTILGNARYGNFFVVYQNVTIGTDLNGVYPTFGTANILYSKSSVIGSCTIGNNVSVAANAFIRNKSIPDDSIVVGMHPNVTIKKNNKDNRNDFFSYTTHH